MRHATSCRSRTTLRALGLGAAITAAALALAACSPSRPQPGTAHGSPAVSRSPSAAVHVGATLGVSDSSGTKLDVTVEKVIDPAATEDCTAVAEKVMDPVATAGARAVADPEKVRDPEAAEV